MERLYQQNFKKFKTGRRVFGFDENAEPLIKELGWKTVRELVRYDTAITMHKSMHKIAPTYLSNIFQPLKDVHQL